MKKNFSLIKTRFRSSFTDINYLVSLKAIMIISLLLYKIILILTYHQFYADEDQTLMWYGTAMFSHWKFPEPCFFGQNYGAMVESILSIPFYMVRIPFRIALPLATAIFSILPISIAILLTHKEEVSWGCFLSFLFVSYPIDILLNVPRNLASGICITTIACIYLIKSNHTMQLIFSSFLLF